MDQAYKIGLLGEYGLKQVLVDRVINTSKNLSMDFTTMDYAKLMYFQIFGKCIVKGLPTEGKRSVLEKHLHEHFSCGEAAGAKTAKTSSVLSPNYIFLKGQLLNA
eukprot:1445863-Rhodomonas_salina.1